MIRMVTQDETSGTQHVPVIALVTDFGTRDAYVGIMKGVMLSICPNAQFIDLTHTVNPQNVLQGAYVLLNAYEYMPPGTIYLVVVDPGVGSVRQPMGVLTDQAAFIGPDNGVLSFVLDQLTVRKMVSLQTYNLDSISSTFHGRDVFSPAAAYLAKGVAFDSLGPSISQYKRLPNPRCTITNNAIYGEVLYIDHFGNIVTSIGRLRWDSNDLLEFNPIFPSETTVDASTMRIRPEACAVEIGDLRISPLSYTYAGVGQQSLLTLINSAGQLEIAVNHGSAAQRLNIQIGDPITMWLNDEG